MIGGIFLVLVAIWLYQAAIQVKKENTVLWVALGCIVFFIVQYLAVRMNASIAESMMAATTERGPDYLDEGYNRRGPINSQSSGGFRSVFLFFLVEIVPPLLGVAGAGVVRSFLILKEKITPKNLFGGIKEMFVNIGNSFKAN
jgi:hypothetical protein